MKRRIPSVHLHVIRAAAIAAVLAWAAAPVAAERELTPEQQEAARSHFEKGKAHFEARAYGLAVDEYIAAFRIAPFPELVFNIGQAYRLDGKLGPSMEAYQMYLDQAPQGDLADEARAHVLAFRSKGVVAASELGKPSDNQVRTPTEPRRQRLVLGGDFSKFDHGTNYSVVGGYYMRLSPSLVFAPRALLGYKIGEDDALTTKGTSISAQARLLAFPARWFFVGGGIGAGASTCSELAPAVGGISDCSGGVFANLFLELGVLAANRYEFALRLHAGIAGDNDEQLDHPLFGLTFAYHL